MIMEFIRYIKNKRASALTMVLIVFMVISILSVAVLLLATNNTRQVQTQHQSIKSYYIAKSGAEVTFQALTTSPSSLLVDFQTGNHIKTSTISFEEGTAQIKVEGFDKGTVRRVRITSIGKMNGSSIERSVVLEFNYADNGDLVWSR